MTNSRSRGVTMPDDYTAYVRDACEAYRLFESMGTKELLDLQAAHRLDQAHQTRPESIAFGAGRLALIAAVLKAREGDLARGGTTGDPSYARTASKRGGSR